MIENLLKLNPKTPNQLSQAKRKLADLFNIPIPTNSYLIEEYRKYIKKSKVMPDDQALLKLLQRRGVRTGSGVAPVAILTKPYHCPGECFYCPNEKGMPKSYLSNEPAVMRAILNKFDPYKQIHTRLAALEANGHPTDKLEIIIMGGTWSYLPKNYQLDYIIKCFKACNEFSSPLFQRGGGGLPPFSKGVGCPQGRRGDFSAHQPISTLKLPAKEKLLAELQKQNEKSSHRIIGLTLETRPDYINAEEIKRMREFGCTRVELGVQAIDDKILSLNNRGHGIKETINATKLLRKAGFKICYHMMVNLPGSTPQKDLKMFKELFSNPDFQPDQIKIYPCVVTKNAPLYKWHKSGKYKPYTEKQLLELLIKIKKIIPEWVRVIRVIRDIPTTSIEAGNKISNLREDIQTIMQKRALACKCIRCREIGKLKIKSSKLIIRKYSAAGGTEYFLSYEDTKQNKLIAFLRLRLPVNPFVKRSRGLPPFLKGVGCPQGRRGIGGGLPPFPKGVGCPQGRRGDFSMLQPAHYQHTFKKIAEKNDSPAIIREVHTYGPAVEISKKTFPLREGLPVRRLGGGWGFAAQHTGFGKKLIKKAEEIARKNGHKKIAVISGVGVRDYYRKLGYRLENTYMVKNLD